MEDIVFLADDLVQKHGTYDPEKLIKFEGISLIKHPMNMSGVFISSCNKKTILINTNLTFLEQITTMYHELLHGIKHNTEDCLFMRDRMLFENNKIENEANSFAAHMIFSYFNEMDIELEIGDKKKKKKLRTYL